MKISSGIDYVDHLLGFLHPGDNIIWEVEAGTYIEVFLQWFVESSLKGGYKVVYVSFNVSPATLSKSFPAFAHLENFTGKSTRDEDHRILNPPN
jgi:KaiC/GvpD/RAD55 family RecA-like ATPase